MIDLARNNPNGLTLKSPVLAAAGSMGYGIEYGRRKATGRDRHSRYRDTPEFLQGPGALITRTTTLHPRRAMPLPRIVETPAGLVYAGEEHNPGLRHVLKRCAPIWSNWDVPVIVSIAGETLQDWVELATQLEGVAGIAGIEINSTAGDTLSPAALAEIIAAVRTVTLLPLLVKLAPAMPDSIELARAAADAGADALSLVAGMPALAIDPVTGEPVAGRLCGPALRPVALALVAAVAEAVSLPIIGTGGIATADDARQFLAVGAHAVGIGAALLADPRVAAQIAADLSART